MSEAAFARVAAAFERLIALPSHERDRALAALSVSDAERHRLIALLAADEAAQTDADDPLAAAIAHVAGHAHACEERIGPYRLIRELGAGGMGTVFLAERVDGQFERRVAIKLLRGFPTREGARRLRQERQILAGLDHPHIARLLDGGETPAGQPWLAMDYVDGEPLLDFIAAEAPRLDQRLALFDAMLDAVAEAHRHLIVHRDLKPGNVLVTADGTVKLLDFGIARLAESDDSGRATSTRVYTLGYASPEQREGRAITTASDLYSLGVLLREALTGHRIEDDRGAATAPPLALDADLAGILAKATDAEPQRRYASAGEFRDDLVRYREGRPVRAARWTRGYRLRKFVGRHRLAFAAGLLSVAVLAGFVWQLAHERSRALAAEASAQQALAASQRDAARARASLEFLRDAFSAASPDVALSSQVSVHDLLDAARRTLESQSDPALVQSMQRLLGGLYRELGDSAAALALLRRGVDGVQPTSRDDAVSLAADLDSQATLLAGNGEHAAALTAAQRAADLRRQFAPDDPVERFRTGVVLGMIAHHAGNDEAAISHLRQALALTGATAVPLEEATGVATNLADLLAAAGEGDEALAIAEAALQRLARERPHGSSAQVGLLRAKANGLRAQGHARGAETVLREAIDLQRQRISPTGSAMMNLHNDLAIALNDQGRYREAIKSFAESDRHLARAGIQSATEHALSLGNLASVHESAGDYAKAIEQYRQAIGLLDEAGIGTDDQFRRRIERQQARTFALAGHHSRATDMLADLRDRARRLDGEDSGEYAMLLWQQTLVARLTHRPDAGLPLVEEAERRWRGLAPAEHPIFLHVRRARAAFALDRGDLASAETEQRIAVAGFETDAALPVDLAIARAELADVLVRRGRRDAARHLLALALPVLRNVVLPQEVSRAAAERTAKRLGLPAAGLDAAHDPVRTAPAPVVAGKAGG